MRSLSLRLCYLFASFLMVTPALAQKGDWYTYTTGPSPVVQLKIDDRELIVGSTGAPSKKARLAGTGAVNDGAMHIEIKRINANDRFYLINLSEDNLYFVTTFKYFRKEDSLQMYCADGVDDGYRTMADAMKAIKKDTGSHFVITLFRQEQLDAQKRKTPITKATEEEFSGGLTRFTQQMDRFWQYRGYGRFEPYYTWMSLIYGNAFAGSFSDQFNPLSLDAKNLKVPISKYSSNPTLKKQLEDAGLLTGNN